MTPDVVALQPGMQFWLVPGVFEVVNRLRRVHGQVRVHRVAHYLTVMRDRSGRPRHLTAISVVAPRVWLRLPPRFHSLPSLLHIGCLEPGQPRLQHLAGLIVGQGFVFHVLDVDLELADGVHEAQLILEQSEVLRQAIVVSKPVNPESLLS